MTEEKKVVDPALADFYEAMEKTNTEKITNEMLAGLSEDSGDSKNLMWEVGTKIPKIGPCGRATLFSESRPSNKVTLMQ
jgi:hypothetical protein